MGWNQETNKSRLAIAVLIANTLALQAGTSSAQDARLEEIIVTATKRSETLQDVPMTVSVFSEEAIREANIFSADDVAVLSPSLTINTNTNPFTAAFRIRGIGTSQSDTALESSVGIFVDDVYMARSGLGMSDLTDIEQIEILHGPQGTLYGRNTNAGAINIRTKRPSFEGYEGYLEANVGDYDLQRYIAAASGPITDKVAFRISGTLHERDGYMENDGTGDDLNDADDWNVQAKLLFDPTDNLSILLNASYIDRDISCCAADAEHGDSVNEQLIAEGFAPDKNDPFDYEGAVDIPSAFENETTNLSLVVDYDTDLGTLTSITAWTNYENFNSYDIDRSELDVMRYIKGASEGDTYSQEFRFAGDAGDSFEYLVGLFYYKSETDAGDGKPFVFLGEDFVTQGQQQEDFVNSLPIPIPLVGIIAQPGDSLRSQNELETESYAAFGQATWQVTDDWRMTGGLRWTEEDKDADLFTEINSTAPSQALLGLSFLTTVSSPIDASLDRSDTDTTWLLSTSYDVATDTVMFATVATGSKSGGFNTVNGTPEQREFESEDTINYELGIKSLLLDSRLQVNASLFYTEVDDYQFQQQLESGVGTIVSNQAEVESSGVDLEVQALILPNLTVGGSLLYLDTYEITDGPQDGNDLPFTAEYSYTLFTTFVLPVMDGLAYTRLDYSYMDDHATRAAPSIEGRDVTDREVFNARLGWRNENWDLSVWGKNLTDDEYTTLTAATFPATSMNAYFLAPPRTWGGTVRYSF